MGFLSSLKLFSSPKSSFTSHANDKMKIDEMARFKEFAAKRIRKELEKSNKDPLTHCSYGVVDGSDDIFRLQGAINIMRPCDTPFEGGVFFLSVELPYNYSFRPPKITFQTKVFHPNLDAGGKIQIDILGKNWSPSWTLEKILLSFSSFLADPNAEVPPVAPSLQYTSMIGNLTSRKRESGL